MQALKLGTQQRFAETSAVGGKLDWDALQDFVTSEGGRRELASLRTTFIDIKSREKDQKVGPFPRDFVQEATGSEQKTDGYVLLVGVQALSINWNQYKDDVEPATLELFKKTFECALHSPSIDVGRLACELYETFGG